jgi:hypothetical protein
MRKKGFFVTTLALCVFAGLNFYSQYSKAEKPIYEYYEFGDSGFMERKGTIDNDKLILAKNNDIEYKDIKSSNFVMSKMAPESLVFSLIDTINLFCKEESCKTYEYIDKGRSSDLEIYHYSNNLHASVYNKDLIYFTIPDEDNRPSQCLYIVTDSKGDKSCRGLDERYYYYKYSRLIDNLVSGHDVEIEYKFDPLFQKFNYIVTFKYGGMPSTIKWFLDFGPAGIFSFVGTNYKTDFASNFKNISLNKSLDFYNSSKPGYKLIPELKTKSLGSYDSIDENLITIKKIGQVIRFYTDFDGKIYLLPYYELTTNNGIYLLLGSEKV